MGARMIGIGTALPEKVLTNHDLAEMMDTSDEWIRERTGIRERRIGLPTSALGVQSGRTALEMAGVDPSEIDLLVLSTTTPDQQVPGTSAVIHAELGLRCGAFDLNAACAGFTYGWVVTQSMMDAPCGPRRTLLIGADSLSPWTDWTDRNTAILFSDGGGAVVLEHTDARTMLSWDLGADGNHRELIRGGHGAKISMDGHEVFKVAVRAVSDSVMAALDRAGLGPEDVDVLLPHQANIRIIEAICKRTGIAFERSCNVIEHTGNNSSGTIPLTMAKAHREGLLQPGALVVMTGFGAGMTWATTVNRW
ncbi:MAG: ketoacyl-ACP synthase III [Acidimicrobiaceae bacterium]|nr:ketoacyl-ACP synthase III [Acidimicrobiaceae bacterium]MCY4175651.1 ketoacyl-ACP synthase III [Acidimicrobiaceae bacterium]MCY4279852.1 ketoacyl-ACP synthase III [Acidimicrobiaceae bacterium]MCY4294637.1 ketoacyl-ACP synthase III [Acidimicrobiaceae bacterium]